MRLSGLSPALAAMVAMLLRLQTKDGRNQGNLENTGERVTSCVCEGLPVGGITRVLESGLIPADCEDEMRVKQTCVNLGKIHK